MAKNETVNTKAAEIKKAIEAKQEEIAAIEKEKEAAADNVAELVAVEKKERRAKSELEALKTAYTAATYTPPAPTDLQELLAGLDKYKKAWNDRTNSIKAKIAELNAEAVEIERGLDKAAEEADTAKTLELANRREENKVARKHLSEMLERAEAVPLYPDGAIQSEWEEICKKLRPEWNNRIIAVKVLAAAYKSAAESLIQMNGTMLSVRNALEKAQDGEFLYSDYTFGETGEDMTIEHPYNARIKSIFNNLTSHGTL